METEIAGSFFQNAGDGFDGIDRKAARDIGEALCGYGWSVHRDRKCDAGFENYGNIAENQAQQRRFGEGGRRVVSI